MRRGYAIQPMDPPALRVTVVVPTRGRAAYLEVTLDSLRRQRTETPTSSSSSTTGQPTRPPRSPSASACG